MNVHYVITEITADTLKSGIRFVPMKHKIS